MAVEAEVDPLPDRAGRRGPEPATSLDRLAVLVVDEAQVVARLNDDLGGQPIVLCEARDPAAGLLMIGRVCPDVVVLGPVTGALSPTQMLEVLREHEPQLPVVVGVGPEDGDLATRISALEPAAMVSRPYRSAHLLRLLRSLAPDGRRIDIGPAPIDLGRLRIEGTAPQMWLDGVHSVLPAREFLLLRYLAERVGRVVSRSEIGAAVWGSAAAGATNTLSVHVMRLRRRFGDNDDGSRWITAVRGVGYRLDVPALPELHE